MTDTQQKSKKAPHPALASFDEERKHLKRLIKAFEGLDRQQAEELCARILPTLRNFDESESSKRAAERRVQDMLDSPPEDLSEHPY